MDTPQRPPAGGFSKRHVSGMMKHLTDDDQKARALEVAAGYKRMFAEKKWEPIMAKLREFAEEDHLRIGSRRRPAPLEQSRRPALTTSASAPPTILLDDQAQVTPLPRLSTASSLLTTGRSRAPSTPRERWDVLSRGPSTPLTPTPTGNAFAGGGFWELLTPKTPAPSTPVTVIACSPYSPTIPQDHEARTAYDLVKKDVEAVSRTVCANRLSNHSRITDSDDIPKSLITLKDNLKGATVALQYRQVDLSTVIDPDLPSRIQGLATEEAKIIQQYTIKSVLELLDIDTWLQVDEQTLHFTTLLDAQRDLLHMHRHRRKSSVIKLPDRAVQLAWAVKLLEDAEQAVDNDDDVDSDYDEEDESYVYSNFLRSIKGEATASNSDLSSLADISSLWSTSSIGESLLRLSRDQSMDSQRNSTSPKKSSTLATRSRKSSTSNSPSSKKRSSVEDEDEAAPLSPEDRAFRRMGASPHAMNTWAEQLKTMEEQQRDKNLDSYRPSQHHACLHPALRHPRTENSQRPISSISAQSQNREAVSVAKHDTSTPHYRSPTPASRRSSPPSPPRPPFEYDFVLSTSSPVPTG